MLPVRNYDGAKQSEHLYTMLEIQDRHLGRSFQNCLGVPLQRVQQVLKSSQMATLFNGISRVPKLLPEAGERHQQRSQACRF